MEARLICWNPYLLVALKPTCKHIGIELQTCVIVGMTYHEYYNSMMKVIQSFNWWNELGLIVSPLIVHI
jgi:hypothetical protein